MKPKLHLAFAAFDSITLKNARRFFKVTDRFLVRTGFATCIFGEPGLRLREQANLAICANLLVAQLRTVTSSLFFGAAFYRSPADTNI
ncbi:MAG: hypothetical protein EA393_14840 [Bacteroidetes bacterium]|nr:MAG: hypothetical protein EA393_14840 [Bacteroidota bacterium]